MKWQHELEKKRLEWKWQDTVWERSVAGGGEWKVTICEVIEHLSMQEIINYDIEKLMAPNHRNERILPGGCPDWEYDHERVANADLECPIILIAHCTGDSVVNKLYILDGNHRLQKAINEGKKSINAKILNLDNPQTPKAFKIVFDGMGT